jgi:hypothetical protein
MDATNKFSRFAAECEDMAKNVRGDDEKSAWHNLAQRWRQCAKANEIRGAALLDAIRRRKPRVSKLWGASST